MMWAAMLLGFFGCFQLGKLYVVAARDFDTNVHLTFWDVSADNLEHPTTLQVRLKKSKTDQFMEGAIVVVGRTDGPLCPVTAMLA